MIVKTEAFLWIVLSSEKKFRLTINEYGVTDEHKTFKGFTNVSNKKDRKECLKMYGGDKLFAKVPPSLEKSFSYGVVIPHKMRNCTDCRSDFLCDQCDILVNQRKELSPNLNVLKRQTPNEFGHVRPKYITT